MRELRIGVIGTGMMGCEHIRNVLALDGARITAVSDPHEMSLVWAQKNLGESARDVGMVGDHRDLLASGLIDAVIVASPNFTHVDVLRDARCCSNTSPPKEVLHQEYERLQKSTPAWPRRQVHAVKLVE